MMFRPKSIVAALAIVLLAAGTAQAQPDPALKPTYGTVALKAGFLPDPHATHVTAGGDLKTNLGGVNAFVARPPDFRLNYTAGQYPLTFHVKSVGDTTLLINLPDGTWIADDDSGEGLDPLIRIAKPKSGQYDIWVGTYNKDLVDATLYITELGMEKKPVPVKANLPDCYILSAGVDNYPYVKPILHGDLNDARNTVAAFKGQKGKMFRNVNDKTLLDGTATQQAILQGLQGFTKQGAAKDYFVLFLSGHGGRTNGNKTWFYFPFDYQNQKQAVTDKQILDIGDELVKQKKNFVVIIDACFCGQLSATAQPYLSRYKAAGEGGMILMLSSSAEQESTALGNYSAFAKAYFDTMAGAGDLNKDGKITLAEIKTYSQQRTKALLAEARSSNKQDTIVTWSPSISENLAFGYTGAAVVATAPPPVGVPTTWVGTETLAGFGKLTFKTYSDGRAVMVDAQSTTEGVWRQQGNQFTLSFSNGSVIYTGTLTGATLSGTATTHGARHDALTTWNFTVKR